MKRVVCIILIALAALQSCDGNELLIPKPPTYLKAELPPHKYVKFEDRCPYTFELAEIYKTKEVSSDN